MADWNSALCAMRRNNGRLGASRMRILIADDHPIVASGCRTVLADEPDIVITEASDAEGAERSFLAERPDICIVDINLPTVSGFELARRILMHDASARIIMFSMNEDPAFVARAIEAGAKGYVSKTGDPNDLLEAIREVGKGGVYLPPGIARSMAFAGPAVAKSPLSKLNSRLIFLSSTAFGEVGPYKKRKGFDLIAHAASGVMSNYADEEGAPRGPGGIPYIDIGMDVHDLGPFAEPLQEGMVLTVEPGIYIELEQMGIRIENNVWLTKNGSIDLMKNIPITVEEIERLMKSRQ